MTVHTRAELESLSRLARREFACGLMSDTKWRKLFDGLAEAKTGIEQMLIKFIDAPDVRTMGLPARDAGWGCPLPHIDTKEFAIIELRSIEWIELPLMAIYPRRNNVPARRVAQDLTQVRAALDAIGQFPITETEGGLRIDGYR